MSDNKKAEVPSYVRFGVASLSGMGATLFVQPLDLLKTRMQLSGEGGVARDHTNSFVAVKNIVKKEGVIGLYAGLSANLFRQATYTSVRMGTFQATLDRLKLRGYQGLPIQISAALAGGFVAAFVATPIDVVVVRMTADGKLPPAERRNYKHVFDALRRIVIEEGVKGAFVGLQPTVLRAMLANTTQLVSYTQAKEFLLNRGYFEDNITCHFISSLISGLVYSTSTCPLDVAKTRMQFMKSDTGQPLYRNMGQALAMTVRKEGVTALWKGFVPLYTRTAPHTVLLLIFSEQLTSFYKQYLVKPNNNES